MPANFNTAVQKFETGRHADAAETCRSLLKTNPGDLSASNMLGVIAATLGEFQQAATCFRACAEGAPNEVGVTTNLAQSLLEIGEHEEALSHFRRAARLQRKDDTRFEAFVSTDMDTSRTETGRPYVATLNDVRTETGYWGIISDGDI